MKSYLTDNEVVLKNYEDVVTFQKLLIENGYVVMVSREEWFWIVNWIWDPENVADRNAVIFISREDYEYEEEQRQKEEKNKKKKRKGTMGIPKLDVKPGDIIHIYHMFGEPQYRDREGTVRSIDDMDQIHGSWGGLALHFDDDWEILAREDCGE